MPDMPDSVRTTSATEPAGKYINLNAQDRFVPTRTLRDAYLRHEGTRAPAAINFVRFEEQGLELGIVSSQAPAIARAVSSLLSCSLEDAKDENGGHLPAEVVERVQLEIISPYGVSQLWGSYGHRFVLSRGVDRDTSEIVATILVARRKGTVFFFTGRYNNVRHSTMGSDIAFDQPAGDDPRHKWFDQFAFPSVAEFKPKAYHHIANFVVAKDHRSQALSRFLLDAILTKYAKDYIEAHGGVIEHSQFLLCGRGFWQIGDPPWLSRMEKLGFYLRRGAESFFIEHDWAPLPRIFVGDQADRRQVSNLEYNRSFKLPVRYQNAQPPSGSQAHHLLQRIPEVIRLSQDPQAKLQYFQTMFDFV
jgi:GNAT superfamily N-acetyltransferase